MDQLYAFTFGQEHQQHELPFVYDPVLEFTRLGVESRTNKWRFSTINESFEVRYSGANDWYSFVPHTQRFSSYPKGLATMF